MNTTVTVLISLGIIIAVSRFSRNLIYALLPATFFLALSNGFTLAAMVEISWRRLSSLDNIFLMTVIFLVIYLSQQMKNTGVMSDLVDTMRKTVSKKDAMAILPALIGILPMPGGALFSAPLVDDCDKEGSIEPLQKTKINYWFRHIWEYWWPLYPGVLLAVDITRIETWRFVFLMFPMTVISVITGRIFLLSGVSEAENTPGISLTSAKFAEIIRLMTPIIVIIGVSTTIRILSDDAVRISKFLPIAAGILAAIFYLQACRPMNSSEWGKIIFSGRILKLFILVAVIRIFGAFVQANLPDGTPLAGHMRSELTGWNIPVICVVMLLPFITGMTTGIAIGFVGASFPIITAMLGTSPSPADLYGYVLLAYGCGYAGMLLSPVHVCLVVTNEHFRTNLIGSLKSLVIPAGVLLAGLAVYYILLQAAFMFIPG